MPENHRIAALEDEITLRTRTIMFLLSEYVARYREDRGKIIKFMEELLPDMPPATAAIAEDLLEHIRST